MFPDITFLSFAFKFRRPNIQYQPENYNHNFLAALLFPTRPKPLL